MLFGSPLRAEISRSGRASPEVRNADSSCDEWTTDLTRYGITSRSVLGTHGSPARQMAAYCGLRNRTRPCETDSLGKQFSDEISELLPLVSIQCRCPRAGVLSVRNYTRGIPAAEPDCTNRLRVIVPVSQLAARGHRHHQVLRCRPRPEGRVLRPPAGRGPRARRRERRGQVDADQDHHRRRAGRRRHAPRRGPGRAAHRPGDRARAGHRGDLPAARRSSRT